jgi:hypothetical protein
MKTAVWCSAFHRNFLYQGPYNIASYVTVDRQDHFLEPEKISAKDVEDRTDPILIDEDEDRLAV